ncbi:Ig-like domain-containing protein [Duffyella gerundensis]|uniref:Ig-like domain-containing protein n=1 Tax=Duffyella gerundensis TaxID=1619313 RepID=UPI003FD12AC1
MTFSGTNHTSVVSLATGQALTHFTENSLVSILSEPAIITLQGAPSQILSFVKQGDDLILHPQNSDAVRYQNFFSQADGRQSELFFRDQGSVQQAMFSEGIGDDAQAIVTLKPSWHLLDSEAPVTPYVASTTAVTELPYLSEANRAQTGAADGQAAPVSSSVITADTGTTSDVTPASLSTAKDMSATAIAVTSPVEPLPELTLAPVTGDNAVSYEEGSYGIIFTGSVAHLPDYTPVEITLDGKTFWGNTFQNEWKVEMNPSDVEAIRDGNYTITVSATDENGNGTSLTQDVLLITHYNSSNPRVTANEVTLASAVQHGDSTWYVLSGTMEMPLPLKSFSVQADGARLSENYQGTFDADGRWSVEMRSGDLREGNNSLTFGVMDRAGNWFEQTISVPADLTTPVDGGGTGTPVPLPPEIPPDGGGTGTPVPLPPEIPPDGDPSSPGNGGVTPPASPPPTLIIDRFTGDAVLSADEKLTAQTLSGTMQNLSAGSTLTVLLNAKTYTSTLAADGSWSVNIPAADLQALPVGTSRVSVSFANSAGGITTASKNITVEPSVPPAGEPLPQPVIETPFGDGLMNSAERLHPFTLTGSTGVTGVGQKIDLTIDDVRYTGTVDAEGRWSVLLLPENGFSEGRHEIVLTATDVWGQTGTVSSSFITDTIEPRVTVNELSDNGVIDATEINSPLLISGSGEAGSAIEVTFGSTVFSGTVDQNGSWQFQVPAETLRGMGEGSFNAVARVTDDAGNSRSAATTVEIFASDALPELTLDPVTGDNAVNYEEGSHGIIFTGTAAHLPSYTPVEITLDGKTFWGNTFQNEWKVEMSPSDVEAIRDGNYTITISAMDENGNSTSLTQDVLLITHYNSSNPRVTANEVTLASAVQHGDDTWYVLSGTMEMPLPLKSVSVQADGTFLSENYQGTFDADGRWSVEMRSGDLHEGNNSLTFGVVDRAGNWFEQTISVPADLTTPVDGGDMKTPEPTIDIPFSDGWLNRAEKEEGQTLNGTTGVTGSGQAVTVIIGGKHHLATVSDDGHWSLPLAPETMKTGFGNGQHGIVVTATDATDHTATIKASYQVDACPPKIAFDNLPAGNKIALHAASGEPQISGTGEKGDIVTVRLGEHQWQTSVSSKGTWAVQLESGDSGLPDPGKHTLTASIRDAAGNVNHVSQQVELFNEKAQSGQTNVLMAEESPLDVAALGSSVNGHGSSTDSSRVISVGQASINHGIDGNIDIFGTESRETFSLPSLTQLTHPDNTAGHDTLPVNDMHDMLDFATLGLKTGNVEVIDLNAFTSNSVMPGHRDSLPPAEDAGEALTIKGADGNAITLSTTEGGVWGEDGHRPLDGQQYDLYHDISASNTGSLADILNQNNVHIQIV